MGLCLLINPGRLDSKQAYCYGRDYAIPSYLSLRGGVFQFFLNVVQRLHKRTEIVEFAMNADRYRPLMVSSLFGSTLSVDIPMLSLQWGVST